MNGVALTAYYVVQGSIKTNFTTFKCGREAGGFEGITTIHLLLTHIFL